MSTVRKLFARVERLARADQLERVSCDTELSLRIEAMSTPELLERASQLARQLDDAGKLSNEDRLRLVRLKECFGGLDEQRS